MVQPIACLYLQLTFNTLQYQGQVGRLQTNLFSLIKCDLSDRNNFLSYLSGLSYLRNLALNKVL